MCMRKTKIIEHVRRLVESDRNISIVTLLCTELTIDCYSWKVLTNYSVQHWGESRIYALYLRLWYIFLFGFMEAQKCIRFATIILLLIIACLINVKVIKLFSSYFNKILWCVKWEVVMELLKYARQSFKLNSHLNFVKH